MRPCLECGQLGDGPRCRAHELEYQRARNHRRTWYHGDWKTLRNKTRGPCSMCGSIVNTQLDHVDPRSRRAGVRRLCAECHRTFGKKFTT